MTPSLKTTRRSFLKVGAASVSSLALTAFPSRLFARVEATADAAENNVVLRFIVMSDVHFNGSPDAPEVDRFRRAIRFTRAYSAQNAYDKFDALVVAGDVSNHGIAEEIGLFKKTMDEEVPSDTQVFICMGNHEFYGGNPQLWQETFGVPVNKRYEANGYQFVALSPSDGGKEDGGYMYAVDWLEKELDAAEAADPTGEKPIFVFQHYPVSATVYGSRGFDDYGSQDIFDTLQKHPRVVDFGGHTHYPVNDPRCAWQGCFSAFGTGTLSYVCLGSEGGRFSRRPTGDKNCGQFYIVEVRRDNSVTLKPYDLATESFFDVVYFIAKPGAVESYVYTDLRYSTSRRPEWPEGSKAWCENVLCDGVTLVLTQATCPDVVIGYRADLERKSASGEWQTSGSRYFWSEHYRRNQPPVLRVEIGGLEDSSEYRIGIAALNPFFKESEEKLETSFATSVDPNAPEDKHAPTPSANILCVRFENGGAVNAPANKLESQKPVELFGRPEINEETELGVQAASFDGVDDYFKIKFDEKDYRTLTRGTIAARFKLDEYQNGIGAIFGNTEGSGIELSVNGQEKALKLWCSVNGAYKILSAPVHSGRWLDAFGTFDGESVVLYLDGKEVARERAPGVLTHPQDAKVQAFCIGADIAPGGVGSAFFKGKIAYAKLYSWALTPEQIANLSKK